MTNYDRLTPARIDVFRSRFERGNDDECWPWKGPVNGDGYGWLSLGWSREARRAYHEKAHRVAWAISRGPVPAGMIVCHRCDNPPCVNPGHLFIGTHGDNMMDRDIKKRGIGGRGTKLAEADITRMRELRSSGSSYAALAVVFGVTQRTVGGICTGRTRRFA